MKKKSILMEIQDIVALVIMVVIFINAEKYFGFNITVYIALATIMVHQWRNENENK